MSKIQTREVAKKFEVWLFVGNLKTQNHEKIKKNSQISLSYFLYNFFMKILGITVFFFFFEEKKWCKNGTK